MMPALRAAPSRRWQRRTPRQERVRLVLFLLAALCVGVAWTGISSKTTWAFVLDSGIQARDLLSRMLPPDVPYAGQLVRPLVDTLHIATLGTVLGFVVAIPLAFVAALPTTPSRTVIRPVALLLLVTSRSVNSIIWALILVVLIGPGTVAGVLAIALRSVGFVGKLVYESIEEAPTLPILAVATTGASRAQTLAYGLVPHLLPVMAGAGVYRWEINIREATILGLVGAGGIGMALQASIDALAWSRVSVILVAILLTVAAAEWASARIRRGFR